MPEALIREFAQFLNASIGVGRYPPALAGDLADLVDSMEAVCSRLREGLLKETPTDRATLDEVLFGLRIELQDDFPMIFRDVISGIDHTIGKFE